MLRNCRYRLAALLASFCLALAGFAVLASPAQADTGTDFWVLCNFTGISKTIDPIVDPGSITTGHFHDFFGNNKINANSTPSTLQSSGALTTSDEDTNSKTSCTTATDTADYWAPTLLIGPGETQDYGPSGYPCAADTGSGSPGSGWRVCHYANIRAYYSRGGASPSKIYGVTPFGTENVAGNAGATGPPASGQYPQVQFACGGSSPEEPYPYNCAQAGYNNPSTDEDGVVIVVDMPRCWNGLDATNRANFAFPTGGTKYSITCPTGNLDLLPLVNPRFHTGILDPCKGLSYDASCYLSNVEAHCTSDTTTCTQAPYSAPNFGFEQSNGSELKWYAAHADFMNGWQYGDHNSNDEVTDTMGGLNDLENDCLLGASSVTCPSNPHSGPNVDNMPT